MTLQKTLAMVLYCHIMYVLNFKLMKVTHRSISFFSPPNAATVLIADITSSAILPALA